MRSETESYGGRAEGSLQRERWALLAGLVVAAAVMLWFASGRIHYAVDFTRHPTPTISGRAGGDCCCILPAA